MLNIINGKISTYFNSRLVRDSFLQFVLNTIGAIISFIQLPILLKMMGGQGFGELVIIQTIASVISALALIQFYQGMMKFIPNSALSFERSCNLVKLGLLNEMITILLAIGLCIFLNKQISLKFPNISSLHGEIILYVTIATILTSTQTIATFLRVIDKYKYVVWWSTICVFLRLLLLVILPILHFSIGTTISISFIFPEVLRIIMLIQQVPRRIFFSKWYSQINLKEIFSFSLIVTIQEWCDLPVKQFDKLILSIFVEPIYVGTYQIIKRVGMLMSMVVSPFSASFFHEFSERVNRNNVKDALSLFRKSVVFFLTISVFIAFILIITKSFWVTKIFGEIQVSPVVIISIILIYVLVNSFNSIHSLLYVIGGTKESLYITIFSNITFLITAALFGYKWHTNGLIVAFSIQVFITIVLKLYVLRKKEKEIISK